MPDLYRWTSVTSIDKDTFKRGDLDYSREGSVDDKHGKAEKKKIPSNKAFWVFDLDQPYRPEEGVVKGCVLLKISLTKDDFNKITANPAPINASGDGDKEFKGEAKHPDDILVKSNEKGAYGIGVGVLRAIHPVKISVASDEEARKALGKGKKDVLPAWYAQAKKEW
jgi:hypothetical protein